MQLCPPHFTGIGKTEQNKHVTKKKRKQDLRTTLIIHAWNKQTKKKLNIKISSHLHFKNTGGRPNSINPLNAELNPICHLLALLGAHHFLHVSRIWVNMYNNSGNHKQPQSCNSSPEMRPVSRYSSKWHDLRHIYVRLNVHSLPSLTHKAVYSLTRLRGQRHVLQLHHSEL